METKGRFVLVENERELGDISENHERSGTLRVIPVERFVKANGISRD